ncbi:hypothetical protein [Gordonia sp. MP11Mi]|uniref:Uncharacterized protein n=1 Tax=Gordonia sp. MP11Mi TaxID=3022769 RepID=A0AA97GSY2_9ACTN
MTGLKVASGGAFVDGTPKVWDGATYHEPKGCYVWRDGEYVKVWPNFMPQGMNKVDSSPVSG